mmetsp:Transcript_23190/g.55068  ORF Transcript_23190/g.55068 Transcript_23190/m.55068 type:complete len:214 (-) Transcript_23190:828-1469(-)
MQWPRRHSGTCHSHTGRMRTDSTSCMYQVDTLHIHQRSAFGTQHCTHNHQHWWCLSLKTNCLDTARNLLTRPSFCTGQRGKACTVPEGLGSPCCRCSQRAPSSSAQKMCPVGSPLVRSLLGSRSLRGTQSRSLRSTLEVPPGKSQPHTCTLSPACSRTTQCSNSRDIGRKNCCLAPTCMIPQGTADMLLAPACARRRNIAQSQSRQLVAVQRR